MRAGDQGPVRVIIVEDEAPMRFLLQELLTLEGYEVLTAEHGTSALCLLQTSTAPTIVIIDYYLPDMTGLELIARLRAETPVPHPACIVTTASAEPEVLLQHPLLEHGTIPVLPKPFELEQLVAAVKQAAQEHLRPTSASTCSPVPLRRAGERFLTDRGHPSKDA